MHKSLYFYKKLCYDMTIMRKRYDTQPSTSTSTSTERLDKRPIALLAAFSLVAAAVCGHEPDGYENTPAWPVSNCSAEVTSAEKDPSGSLQVGVELGADCEGAQGHRHVTVEDPGLAKVEPGDDARVAVTSDFRVFVHFPQDGKDTYGLVDVAGRVQ